MLFHRDARLKDIKSVGQEEIFNSPENVVFSRMEHRARDAFEEIFRVSYRFLG